jgi:hypothetical protein
VDIGPACGPDFDDARGAHAFGDEVGLKSDLDAAAAERGISGQLRDVEEFAACGHLRGAGGAAFGVLQVFSTPFISAAMPGLKSA